MYYNRGVVHSYLENYHEAYNDFLVCDEIDKNLKAKDLAENILTYTTQASKLIKNQCAMKPKKLAQIVATIPVNLKDDVGLRLGGVSALTCGENKGIVISSKAVQSMDKVFEVPL